MLGNFPWYGRHIRGFPRKNVLVRTEEVDEHAFLFWGEGSANAYRLAIRAAGVDEDLLGVLGQLK
jgi:hypothetical protein